MNRKRTVAGGVAGAAILTVLGGAAVASSAGTQDDDQPITGQALERASSAAVDHVGGGEVTETEVEDEESAYEVEVMRPDGTQVEVQLDSSFAVLGVEDDNDDDENDDDDGDDSRDDSRDDAEDSEAK